MTENSTRQTGDHSDESYSPSDGSLVRQYRAGSETAADELYRRYAGRLRRLAWIKSMRSRDRRVDDSDIVQSVFRRFFIASRRGDYDIPQGEDLWNLLLVIAPTKFVTRSNSSSPPIAMCRTVSMESAQDAATDIQLREDRRLRFSAHLCRRSDGTIAGRLCSRGAGAHGRLRSSGNSASLESIETNCGTHPARIARPFAEYIGEDHS